MTLVRPRAIALMALAGAFVCAPLALVAQGTEPTKVVTPTLDFSGVIYGNYRYTLRFCFT